MLTALVVLLAQGHLPFDRPALAALPFAVQVAAPTVGLIEVFLLMGLVWLLTRRRGRRRGRRGGGGARCR